MYYCNCGNEIPRNKRVNLCESCHKERLKIQKRKSDNERYFIKRQEVLTRYGGKCKNCNDDFLPILEIDHVKGGVGRVRSYEDKQIYKFLYGKSTDLDTYQVLCSNCNWLKHKSSKNAFSTNKHTRKNVMNFWNKKEQIIQHYGGKCVCCNMSNIDVLSIDHINGDGAEHRRNNQFRNTIDFYRWIITNNYPFDLQVLCRNCNQSKRTNGYCAHKLHEISKLLEILK